MATYQLKFGNYVFPVTFYPAQVPAESRLGTVEIPRRHGVAVGEPLLREKTISIRGMLRAADPDAMRSAMDTLLAAVNAGRQKLYLWADRFIWATKTGFTTDYEPTSFKRYCLIEINFTCDTALWEAENESSNTWSNPVSGSTRDITTGGNAEVYPVFEFTFAGTGSLDVRLGIGNVYFTLTGAATDGDVVVVDCGEESVVMASSGNDYMNLFDSVFFKLGAGGINRLSFTDNGGTVSVSQIVTRWRDRWY
ncbi:phage tail family protein [bacterium]|nr:phage tail family protein [bacterium]